MAYSDEIMELIQEIATYDESLAKKVLIGNLDAIRSLGQDYFIDPNQVLEAIQNKKTKELGVYAKFLITKKKLYELLIREPSLYSNSSNKTKGGK